MCLFLSQKQNQTKTNKQKQKQKNELPSETQSIQYHRLFVITVIIFEATLLTRIMFPYPTERKFAVGKVGSAQSIQVSKLSSKIKA